MSGDRHRGRPVLVLFVVAMLGLGTHPVVAAEVAEDATFDATFIDASGLRTDVTNMVFYWEEKLSETQLALHELRHVPARRGTVPIKIQFSRIKSIEFKSSDGRGDPVLSITLKNGKTGEFNLEIPGSFKGQTEFGEMIASPAQLKKVVIK